MPSRHPKTPRVLETPAIIRISKDCLFHSLGFLLFCEQVSIRRVSSTFLAISSLVLQQTKTFNDSQISLSDGGNVANILKTYCRSLKCLTLGSCVDSFPDHGALTEFMTSFTRLEKLEICRLEYLPFDFSRSWDHFAQTISTNLPNISKLTLCSVAVCFHINLCSLRCKLKVINLSGFALRGLKKFLRNDSLECLYLPSAFSKDNPSLSTCFDDIGILRNLRELTFRSFYTVDVDATLLAISVCTPNLCELHVRSTLSGRFATTQGFGHLRKLEYLRKLSFFLADFSQFHELRYQDGIFRALEYLQVCHCKLTDQCLKNIRLLIPKLHKIRLSPYGVLLTVGGLEYLSGLSVLVANESGRWDNDGKVRWDWKMWDKEKGTMVGDTQMLVFDLV